MKTILIRIQRPDTPAWIIDKKGALLESLKVSVSSHGNTHQAKENQAVLDIITTPHEFLRELNLPSKNFDQFKKMVPHQIRSLHPSTTHHTTWVYECFPVTSPTPHQYSAIVLAHDSKEWSQTSNGGQKQSKQSHGQMSDTLALMYAYQDSLIQGEQANHIFHRHQKTLWHLYRPNGSDSPHVIHVGVSHFSPEDETLSENRSVVDVIGQLIEQVHHWHVPSSIQIHMNPLLAGPPAQQEILKTFHAQPLMLTQFTGDSHDELLLHGAVRAIQESSSLPIPFDEHSQSDSDNASQLKSVHVFGISLLFLLGTCWLSNMLMTQELSAHSSNLLRYLQNIHQQTLPAGQRRHFSEMTLVKRLELATKSKHQQAQSDATFLHFFSELQAHLLRCPDFQCERLQSQTHEGKFQLQGLVNSVQHFDELTHIFQENKKWKIQSNFTRSSSSKEHGFKVNLSIEVLP